MMQGITDHDDIRSLLGAYALDAVERDEADLLTRHMEVCPRCRAEVREHREVAGLLGYAGQEAPEGLWDRIAASTQEPPPMLRLSQLPHPVVAAAPGVGTGAPDATVTRLTDAPNRPATHSAARRRAAAMRTNRTLRVRTVAVLGAAAAVVVALLGVQVVHLDNRTATLTKQMGRTLAPTTSMEAVNVALTVPGARKVVLSPVGSNQSADAVILPTGQGYLYDSTLSSLPEAQTYQLWGTSGGQPVSYGLLGSTPESVVSFRAGAGVQVLAITAETSGGVARSGHAPVVSGEVIPTL